MSSTPIGESLSSRQGAQQVLDPIAWELDEAALEQIARGRVLVDPRPGLVLGHRVAGDQRLAPGVGELGMGAIGDAAKERVLAQGEGVAFTLVELGEVGGALEVQ